MTRTEGAFLILRMCGAAVAIAIAATTVYAQSAAIGQRQQSMKAIAGAAKEPGAILKGQAPFDLGQVQSSLKIYQQEGEKLKTLWPDDSKAGDHASMPEIWEKKAHFLGLLDKFVADSKAAETAITDEATLKAEWPKVMRSCGGCHREFRKPS